MSYNRSQLIDLVSSRMDEVLPAVDQKGASNLEAPISNIEIELNEGANRALHIVSRDLLIGIAKEHSEQATITPKKDGSGSISLPTDYLRFVRLELSDWKRPVDQIISVDDPKYKWQFNRNLRGTIYKPVVVLTQNTIEYYTTQEETPTIKSFKYIPQTLPENMPNALIDGMVWLVASRALSINGHSNEANYAYGQAIESLTNNKIGIKGE